MRTILQIMAQIRQLAQLRNGLSQSQIDAIPEIPFKRNSQDLYCGDKCVICLKDLVENEMVKGLKCMHFFHSECINPWLKVKTHCPICRQKVVV